MGFTNDSTGIATMCHLEELQGSNYKELMDLENTLVTLDRGHQTPKVGNSVLRSKLRRIKEVSQTSLWVGRQPILDQKLVDSNLTGSRELTCSQYSLITTTSCSIRIRAKLKSHHPKDSSSVELNRVEPRSVTPRKFVTQAQGPTRRTQDFSKGLLSKAVHLSTRCRLKELLTFIRAQSETKSPILKF